MKRAPAFFNRQARLLCCEKLFYQSTLAETSITDARSLTRPFKIQLHLIISSCLFIETLNLHDSNNCMCIFIAKKN
jgi:hypothetical protein